MNDSIPLYSNDLAHGSNAICDHVDTDDDDDDRKIMGTTKTITTVMAQVVTTSDHFDPNDAIISSSSNDANVVVTSTAEPNSSECQQQHQQQQIIMIKKRQNAMSSKQKYYKKKRYIEELKHKEIQLTKNNQQLHASNRQLERMLFQAKELIAIKKNTKKNIKRVALQLFSQPQLQRHMYQSLSPSQLQNTISTTLLNTNSDVVLSSSKKRSSLQHHHQQQSYPTATSTCTTTGSQSIGQQHSSSLPRKEGSSNTISSHLLSSQVPEALKNNYGLAASNFINVDNMNSNNILHVNNYILQQSLPTTTTTAPAPVTPYTNYSTRLAQLISNDKQYGASWNRNMGIYSSSSSSTLPCTTVGIPTTTQSSFESALLLSWLRQQQNLSNRHNINASFDRRFDNRSCQRDAMVRDYFNGVLHRDVTETGDIGSQLIQSQLFSTSIRAVPNTLHDLIFALPVDQQKQQHRR